LARAEARRARASWPLVLAFVAAGAHADLYRWIDPESGSVKLSTLPPPAGVHAEIVPSRGQPFAPESKAAAASAPKAPSPARGTDLESRWRELLGILMRTDLRSRDEPLRQQLQLFEAMGSELDRIDPAGTARRRAEQAPLTERLRQAAAQ